MVKSFHNMAAILDFSKILFLAKLQERLDYNLKYCMLRNSCSYVCGCFFSINVFVTNKSKR